MTTKTTFQRAREEKERLKFIREAVAYAFGMTEQELLRRSHKNRRDTEARAWPRFVGAYLSRRLAESVWVKIGREYGFKDHSGAVYAVKQVINRISVDPQFKGQVEFLEQGLQRKFVQQVDSIPLPESAVVLSGAESAE